MRVAPVLAQQVAACQNARCGSAGTGRSACAAYSGRACGVQASVARSASRAASAIASEAMTSSPSSRRSVVSAARSRAPRTTSGEAVSQTAGTWRATSAGLKL